METRAHRQLKTLAVNFLHSCGARAIALEVTCPVPRYRVDAAGYCDASPRNGAGGDRAVAARSRRGRELACILIECKQSRSDFLRDNRDVPDLLQRRRRLDAIRRAIEEQRIKREEPELCRTGSALFAELEEWDFARSRLPGYRRVLDRLRRIDEQLYGETKFHLLARYALAERMYLLAPRGMIRPSEIPPGWGLLECPPQWLDGEAHRDRLDGPPVPKVAVEAPRHACQERHRLRLLRNIAVAASKAAFRRGAWRG